jgi:hypothetical protein
MFLLMTVSATWALDLNFILQKVWPDMVSLFQPVICAALGPWQVEAVHGHLRIASREKNIISRVGLRKPDKVPKLINKHATRPINYVA